MAKYVLTNKAVEDLTEIWNYSFDTWSETQAIVYYQYLIETFHEISENPLLGKSYFEIHEEIYGFRMKQHLIFYRILKTKSVEIVRILHGRMDLKRRLEPVLEKHPMFAGITIQFDFDPLSHY